MAKDTAVYGLSSIVGRFLNWCLVPLYVYLFSPEEYGVVSYLYSFTAVALVVLNYGMETGYFRFAGRPDTDADTVYTTSLISIGSTSVLFVVLISLFLQPVSNAIKMQGCELYVWLLAVIIAIDAFSNLPFAYLRRCNRAIRFATIKMTNVALNIGLNLFFLLACPAIERSCPAAIGWFYPQMGGHAFGIGWIFVANIISTVVVLLMLLPELTGRRYRFDGTLLKRMLSYSWPLLILGVAGIMSQNMGQMLIPFLISDETAARTMVGIYGANIKIAIVMVMFTQAFRYAYEPFIFARANDSGADRSRVYCDAMKFFVIFGLFIFLGVMFFLPVLKHFVSAAYWPGLKVVPVMMMAELFFGVFFNLSLWYKLTDRTRWGMYFSLFGFAVMLGLNLWWVPMIGSPNGYMGSAWAAFAGYLLMMIASYLVGRHYYPLPYQTLRMGLYAVLAMVLWGVGEWMGEPWGSPALMYALRTLLLVVYAAAVFAIERKR